MMFCVVYADDGSAENKKPFSFWNSSERNMFGGCEIDCNRFALLRVLCDGRHFYGQGQLAKLGDSVCLL